MRAHELSMCICTHMCLSTFLPEGGQEEWIGVEDGGGTPPPPLTSCTNLVSPFSNPTYSLL